MVNLQHLLDKYTHKLELTEGRRIILSLEEQPPLGELLKKFAQYGVTLIKTNEELGESDCKSWALEQVGLNKNYGGFLSRDMIIEEKLKRLRARETLSEDYLVAYFIDDTELFYSHWGVCVNSNGGPMVLSRWGKNGHLFTHPLEIIPPPYGNLANFIEVQKEQ